MKREIKREMMFAASVKPQWNNVYLNVIRTLSLPQISRNTATNILRFNAESAADSWTETWLAFVKKNKSTKRNVKLVMSWSVSTLPLTNVNRAGVFLKPIQWSPQGAINQLILQVQLAFRNQTSMQAQKCCGTNVPAAACISLKSLKHLTTQLCRNNQSRLLPLVT